MSASPDPIIGNRYQDLDKDEQFEVLAVDEDNGTVEVQYLDGSLDAIELDTWHDMEFESIDAPDDWTGSPDELERDDSVCLESDADDWPRPRGTSRRSAESWEDEDADEDKWIEADTGEEPWWEES